MTVQSENERNKALVDEYFKVAGDFKEEIAEKKDPENQSILLAGVAVAMGPALRAGELPPQALCGLSGLAGLAI
jgi:hypothetical protein